MVKTVHKYEDQVHGGLYDTPADAIAAEHIHVARTKKFIVGCCKYCPLIDKAFDPVLKGRFVCTHAATERQIIDDVDIVPTWCMLEDD